MRCIIYYTIIHQKFSLMILMHAYGAWIIHVKFIYIYIYIYIYMLRAIYQSALSPDGTDLSNDMLTRWVG